MNLNRLELHTQAQGFPQLLRTWWGGGGALQNLMGGLSQYMGGAWVFKCCLKIPVKEFI